jgi:hypothetical protein
MNVVLPFHAVHVFVELCYIYVNLNHTPMYRISFLALALLLSLAIAGQELSIPSKHVKRIKEKDLVETMKVLTSDSLAGRETGHPGADKAAKYISDYFKAIGLSPMPSSDGYLQRFDLWRLQAGIPQMVFNGDTLQGSDMFVSFGDLPTNNFESKPIVFVGYGSDSIIGSTDFTNKIAMVVVANASNRRRITNALLRKGAWASLVLFADEKEYTDLAKRMANYYDKNYLSPKKPEVGFRGDRNVALSAAATMKITGKTAAEWANEANGLKQPVDLGQSLAMKLPIDVVCVPAYNVVGVLKGNQPNNAPVAVTAHYDHVGVQPDGSVCLGADDNASGVSTMMELAETFAKKHPAPLRDVYFVAFSAEEMGLYGSAHFMKDRKKEDFFANINIDMIGRRDTLTKDNYVYILGTDKNAWTHKLHQRANSQTTNLSLDYHYNQSSGYGSYMNRSDHYHFYKLGIPVVSFFSGLHGDYHTPRDTMDKIDFPLLTKRVKLIYGTLYLLANEQPSLN